MLRLCDSKGHGTGGPAIAKQVPEPHIRPRRILVVEDVPSNSDMIAIFLRFNGYLVDVATNGRLALERLSNTEYDAILMDIQMPVMRGDEAIHAIRSSTEYYRDIPIIALSADASRRTRDNIQALGASAFFAKPFELAAILEMLKSLSESFRSDRLSEEKQRA